MASYKENFSEKILQIIHPLVVKLLSLKRDFRLEINGEIPYKKQFIFVANHYCIDDIPTAGEVIGTHTYVLVSDEDKGTLNGLALDLNGVVWTNRLSKIERTLSKDALVRHLKLGRNILMYPESTWNLSPNLLMLPMNYGCITISLETGIPIIPLYLYFSETENVCRVIINEPFYPNSDKLESISRLRDILATSAWNCYEKEAPLCRSNLSYDYWEKNISERYDKYDRARKDPVGVREYETKLIFRPKGIVYTGEAFEHLNKLNPCHENAFLFRKS